MEDVTLGAKEGRRRREELADVAEHRYYTEVVNPTARFRRGSREGQFLYSAPPFTLRGNPLLSSRSLWSEFHSEKVGGALDCKVSPCRNKRGDARFELLHRGLIAGLAQWHDRALRRLER